MFEMLSPRFYPNIAPKRDALLLHGARDRETLEEFIPEEVATLYGWECVPAYKFDSLAAVLAAARTLDVTQQEGFVCPSCCTSAHSARNRLQWMQAVIE